MGSEDISLSITDLEFKVIRRNKFNQNVKND